MFISVILVSHALNVRDSDLSDGRLFVIYVCKWLCIVYAVIDASFQNVIINRSDIEPTKPNCRKCECYKYLNMQFLPFILYLKISSLAAINVDNPHSRNN